MTQTINTVSELRHHVRTWRKQGKTIALVPTMGALHDGHMSLVHHAKKKADRVIVSIFVNPTQFSAGEDLESYPRPLEKDRTILARAGADLLYAPSVTEMYPEGFSTSVMVDGISRILCGASRRGHFDGVATVVTKLLMQALPDIAVFGEKDFQQRLLITKMVRELDIPVKIAGAPILREKDGLAMSSRNLYLDKTQRAIAPFLYRTLENSLALLEQGETTDAVLALATGKLAGYGFRVDYLELRYCDNLKTVSGEISRPARLFVAAFLGKTRLIDNLAVPEQTAITPL